MTTETNTDSSNIALYTKLASGSILLMGLGLGLETPDPGLQTGLQIQPGAESD